MKEQGQTARREDPRVARSKKAIINALFDLLESRPLEEVTLAEVAQRAHVSRVTVYGHFGSRDELLVQAMESSIGRVYDKAVAIESAGSQHIDGIPVDLIEVFEVFDEHRELYRAMLGPAGSMRFYRRLRERMREAILETVRRLRTDVRSWPVQVDTYCDYIAGAVLSVAWGWLDSPQGRSARDVARECWLLVRTNPDEFS